VAGDVTLGGEIGALAALAEEVEQGVSETRRKDMHYQAYLQREHRQRYDTER
jgi:hypothetical protein